MFPEPDKFPLWKRFLLASLVMVVVSGSVTALAAFSLREDIAKELGQSALPAAVSDWLVPSKGAQTILLIGSDGRASDAKGYKSRSDTMILVRLNPNKATTSVMSLPRDLKVPIKGFGNDKLSHSYAFGGTKLTLRTITEYTGLNINHVVNINFRGFRQAVDSVGCVYVDVDRRYFNDNSNLPIGAQYAVIDIKPGYQKMCGTKALDYVRFRHEDSDIVRGARQQDFLRQAKDQVGVTKLFNNFGKLKRVVTKNTRTDIRDGVVLQRLLSLAVVSAPKTVSEVRLRTSFEGSFVVASQDAVAKAVREFKAGRPTRGKHRTATRRANVPRRRKRAPVRLSAGLESAPIDGRAQGVAASAKARLPVYYPTLRQSGSRYSLLPRVYAITTPDGTKKNSYRIVARTSLIGEYYGIQGTHWKDAPVLSEPHEQRVVRGRNLDLYWEADRLRMVSWRRGNAVYWVSNSLSRVLTARQMIQIAASLKRAP